MLFILLHCINLFVNKTEYWCLNTIFSPLENILEPSHSVTKVITWNRSTSARSSSSRSPLATASKDDNDDSGSEFAEEFCMIAGSHSSTLDRMYAWERKLYDEVKVCVSIICNFNNFFTVI